MPSVRLELLRRLDPVVEVLEDERQADRERSGSAANDNIRSRWMFGEIGARGTSAGSTTRTLLVRSSLEMPVSFVRCIRLS